jgi:hypothetical protein
VYSRLRLVRPSMLVPNRIYSLSQIKKKTGYVLSTCTKNQRARNFPTEEISALFTCCARNTINTHELYQPVYPLGQKYLSPNSRNTEYYKVLVVTIFAHLIAICFVRHFVEYLRHILLGKSNQCHNQSASLNIFVSAVKCGMSAR